MNTTQVVMIKNASFFVGSDGELWASEDMQRFFPIDGMLYMGMPYNSAELTDFILPFQITENGQHHFYKYTNETKDTASVGIDTTASTDKGVNYYEPEDSEDVEEFIKELDKSVKGCLYRLAAILAIIITVLIVMCK